MREVDVAIIGAGSAGLSARREVAKETNNYVVIDGGTLGTTCARVGCMPSKVLIQVAEDFERRHKYKEEGIELNGELSIDSKQVMKHVRKLRDRFVRGVIGDMESWVNTHFIAGYAQLLDENTLEVNSEKIKFKKLIIGIGTTPNIPEMFKDYPEHLLTTDTFFEIDNLPKSMAILGLGVIGLELGQACHRLGVDLVGIARRKSLAGISDPKLLDYAYEKFSNMMNLSFDGVDSVTKEGDLLCLKSGSKTFKVEKVLLTAGRSLQYGRLNLAAIGLDNNSVPAYNKETLNLEKFPHIFIAGDTTGEKQILHEASDEGRIAGHNAVHGLTKFVRRTPLLIAFTDPNIAFAGMKYSELEQGQEPYEIGEVSFEGQGRSIIKLKEIGHLSLYGHKETGRILGAEIMGPDSEHLAHLISWMIQCKLDVYQALALPFYHPVVEEGLRTALRSLRAKVHAPKELSPLEIPLQ